MINASIGCSLRQLSTQSLPSNPCGVKEIRTSLLSVGLPFMKAGFKEDIHSPIAVNQTTKRSINKYLTQVKRISAELAWILLMVMLEIFSVIISKLEDYCIFLNTSASTKFLILCCLWPMLILTKKKIPPTCSWRQNRSFISFEVGF